MNLLKRVVGLILAAGLASVAFSAGVPRIALAAAAEQATVDQFEVRVSGMACPFCAYGIEKKLKALPGARDVKVDLEGGKATFEAPAGAVSRQQVEKAIKDAGFSPGQIDVKHKAG